MKSTAATVPAYLASLPADRREALEAVRKVILKNLDPSFQECMQYGVVGYVLPHSIWPHGHHAKPELPLMYMGMSSQKNDMVVYMLMLLHNKPMREWFETAWQATGRKSHLEVTGMGCCLRFKELEDLSLEVIADLMRRTPAKKYLQDHVAMLAARGLGPDGKKLKGGTPTPAPAKRTPAKKTAAKKTPTKKPATKAASSKAGKETAKR
ncbi:MAG TPA: DUF1801 domain-containing protein [Phycisphaerales bacterium]|nr:DUF1801 domain-containing protein [Phycisphaerales bacterium]